MSQTELVVDASAALEELLATRLGAQGNGLGEKIRSVQERLPRDVADKLFYVNRERNALLHPPRRPLGDAERFAGAVAESIAWLTGDAQATPASVLAHMQSGGPAAAARPVRVVRAPTYWLGRIVQYVLPTRRARLAAAVIVPLYVLGWAALLVSQGMGSLVQEALGEVFVATAALVCNFVVIKAIWPYVAFLFRRPTTPFGWIAAVLCGAAACVALLALVLPHTMLAPVADRAADALGIYSEKVWAIVGVPLVVFVALWLFI